MYNKVRVNVRVGFNDRFVIDTVARLTSVSFRKFRYKSGAMSDAADFSGDYPIKLGNYISMIDFANSPTPFLHSGRGGGDGGVARKLVVRRIRGALRLSWSMLVLLVSAGYPTG